MSEHQMQPTLLVVEDEMKIARLLQDYLTQANYRSHWIDNGTEVVDWVRRNQPDMVLLDLMLPGRDGISICRELREFTQVPVIMITARVEEIDRILGLEIGANDYICKPFSPREVIARVKALFRTLASQDHPVTTESASVMIDQDRMQVQLFGQPLDLTPVEFRLFTTLAGQVGRIFSRSRLMETLYDDHRVVTDRTVDSHIKNLRKKITDQHGDAECIKSVYGVGYKFEI